MLNVHIVCHSHNDVGWTETPEVIYNEYVQDIYSSVTAALHKSRDRKYVSAETAFFERWWQDQLPPRRNSVRKLIQLGQLEMAGGGWVQSDEATTHYSAIVDQMSIGLRWLNDTFGECGRPRIAWQVDPYGHSRENAALFAQMGFDAIFLGRVHVADKEHRRRQRSLEFVWNTDRTIGSGADLFASILPNVYMPPRGFCFDKYSCTTNPDVLVRGEAEISPRITPVLLCPLAKFACMRLNAWEACEILIYMSTERGTGSAQNELQAFYSSPSCYLKALNVANRSWPAHTRDFLPYADRPQIYWTGFYSSRPALKRYARQANGFLQKVISDGLVSLMWRNPDSYDESLQFCHRLNETICYITENENKFLVITYNPMGQRMKYYVRLPVPFNDGYVVETRDKETIQSQVVPMANTVMDLPLNKHIAMNELVFQVEMPPVGATAYQVSRLPVGKLPNENYDIFKIDLEESSIENEKYRLIVDVTTGLLKEVIILERGETLLLRQSFFCYEGQNTGGKASASSPKSGAYIFNPADDEPYDLGTHVTYRIIKGNVVQEIQQVFDSWITQVIRLYKGLDLIEFEWMVGPIPVESRRSKAVSREIVTRYSTNLQNDGIFYTDSNGRTTIERRRGPMAKKGTDNWKTTGSQYYPVVSWVYIKVHRRLVEDDGCGLGEALNDTSVVRGRHWVHLGTSGWPRMRQQALQLVYAPVLSYYKLGRESLDGMLVTGNFSGLREELPDNAHLLTLEAVSASRILIRLEHINIDKNDKDANDKLISITHLLRSNQLEDVHEASLSGHMLLDEMRRLQWRQTQTSGGPSGTIGGSGVVREQDNYSVQLSDGRIRTFYASLSPKTR
ncbi:hypothetical protein HPB52_006179 [Rhipicephalus sanguineus]|uniref:Alpha-mannosidase n=1 Tax=Rhipicephalus sanguineus TaxID=34632 RepID=A0A9D4QI63_RHISA|nr:hypothetical protein HPB52_006179 [Rhipicephalus sanguineus]